MCLLVALMFLKKERRDQQFKTKFQTSQFTSLPLAGRIKLKREKCRMRKLNFEFEKLKTLKKKLGPKSFDIQPERKISLKRVGELYVEMERKSPKWTEYNDEWRGKLKAKMDWSSSSSRRIVDK